MSDDAIETGIELASELRAIARELTDRKVDAEGMRAALELVRQVRPHLAGEPRRRWYDLSGPPAPSLLGPFETLSPVRGLLNPVAPPLQTEVGRRANGEPCVIGRARLSRVYEGPPHGAHGGIVAAMFDEILGSAQALVPPTGVTGKLEVRYHHLTPLDEELRFEAWITEVRGRRVHAAATCHAGETLTARSRALFVRIDYEAVQERMKARAAARSKEED